MQLPCEICGATIGVHDTCARCESMITQLTPKVYRYLLDVMIEVAKAAAAEAVETHSDGFQHVPKLGE